MTLLAILLAYGVIWLFAARRIFYAMRNDDPSADGIDAVMLGLLAFIVGMLWPLALPVAAVMWKPRKTVAELREEAETAKWEQRKLQTRIDELERQLGIGQ